MESWNLVNNVKINARQFAIFVILFSIGTTLLYIPGVVAQVGKQDGWIGAIVGTGLSLLLVFLFSTVCKMLPNMTLVEMIEKVFGMWLGKLVSLSFIFFSFLSAALLLADVGNFISIQLMNDTPEAAIQILFACIVIMGIRLGLETLARSAEILFTCFLFLFIILVLSLLPQIELKNIQPLFESGFKPVIRASFLFTSFFSLPLVVLLMIFPSSVNQHKKAEKGFYLGVLIGGIILIIVIVLTILVLGADLSAAQMYPSYSLARVVKVGNFFQRVEAIMATMWLITLYFKLMLYFYAAVIGLAQTLKLNDYLPITLPFGMLIVLLSFMVSPNTTSDSVFNEEIWPFFVSTFGLVLPILLIAVHLIRKTIKQIKK